jgi:NTP pyrophosphatase (non-canonical NTP hydrolase)
MGESKQLFSMNYYIGKVEQWHIERNLIEGSDDKSQVMKLIQELGELSDSVCKDKSVIDDIGDMLVVMINICVRNHVTLEDCLSHSWNEIKDRKGVMKDGVFIKQQDL